MSEAESVLHTIARLAATRDFSRDIKDKQDILDTIAILVRPWATNLDVI